jgi:hypothetical protein
MERRMPIPPLLFVTLGLMGTAALIGLVVKERKRVNAELEKARAKARTTTHEPRATLRRDPRTGVYRP